MRTVPAGLAVLTAPALLVAIRLELFLVAALRVWVVPAVFVFLTVFPAVLLAVPRAAPVRVPVRVLLCVVFVVFVVSLLMPSLLILVPITLLSPAK